MSERKVLNKYYPPDFDPSKIPRMKLPKNRQYTVRLMAPFNMRCATCGEYIYRGKKFNARKEDVENEDYCGVRIYRFYIKCTRCLQEISFRTDPKNTDYEIEAGAIRNFMTLKIAEEEEKKLEEEMKEEEAINPMTLLENRTKQSNTELQRMEALEELKELNARHLKTDFNELLKKYDTTEVREKLKKFQEEKDDEMVKSLLGKRKKEAVEEVVVDVDENPACGSSRVTAVAVPPKISAKSEKPGSGFGSSLMSGPKMNSGAVPSKLSANSEKPGSSFGSSLLSGPKMNSGAVPSKFSAWAAAKSKKKKEEPK